MQFSALKTEVTNHQLPSTATSRIENWLNDGLRYVVRHTALPDYETSASLVSVAGTATIALPSDFGVALKLQDTAIYDVLERTTRDEFLQYNTSVRGRPFKYALYGSNIQLYPTPNAVYSYTLLYRKVPVAMSADADTPAFPSEYHHLLIDYALHRAWRAHEDEKRADYYWQEFRRELNEVKWDLEHRNEDGNVQIVGTTDW